MAKHSTRASAAPTRELPDPGALRADQRRRRDGIIDAAVRAMVEVDYARIQVKDVADDAGVALGTLYRYFNSKDHLFACALLQWSSGFGSRIEQPARAPAADRVAAVYRRAARAFERAPRVFDVLTQLQGSRDEHAAKVFGEFSRLQEDAFSAALDGIPAPERDDIVNVMSAVLAESLRGWQLGMLTLRELYARIERAAELVLGR